MGSQPESYEAVDILRRIQPELAKSFTTYPRCQHSSVLDALPILHEGLLAYESGAIGPAALAARAAVEAAGYLFLTRRATSDGAVTRLPKHWKGNIPNVSFEDIMMALEKRRALNSTLSEAARRIQRDGNLVAHVASRNDRDTARAVERTWKTTIEERDPRKPILLHPSFEELRKKALEDPDHLLDIMFQEDDAGLEPIRLYPLKEEVYRNLEGAGQIILALIRADGGAKPASD